MIETCTNDINPEKNHHNPFRNNREIEVTIYYNNRENQKKTVFFSDEDLKRKL